MDTDSSVDDLPDWASDMWAEEQVPPEKDAMLGLLQGLVAAKSEDAGRGFSWRMVPGVTGDLTRWILSQSQYPQPELAVASALAFVSLCKSHRVRTETDLRTNLLLAGIAPSGSGKNWPLLSIRKLGDVLDLSALFLGEPASDSGLLASLERAGGRGLLVWDEFGDALKQLTSAQSGAFQREILVLMKKLFSSASVTFQGSFAVTREQRIVKQPCLTVIGAATPERLYSALSSNLVEDGFLSRFLFVEPDHTDVDRVDVVVSAPPSELVFKLRRILQWQTNADAVPGTNFFDTLLIQPRVVPLSPQARQLLPEYAKYFRDHMRACAGKEEVMRAVWARGEEHMLKVALTVTDESAIGVSELMWAFEFVSDCMSKLIQKFGERVAETGTERNLKRVLACIRRRGSISHSDLVRSTNGMSTRERAEALETLLQGDDILKYSEKKDGSHKRSVYYRLV